MKTQMRFLAAWIIAISAATLLALPTKLQAQNTPLITLDEKGNGSLLFSGSAPVTLTGTLAPDPGPGGKSAALTYNLLGPPGLIAGDLIVLDAGMIVSDIIRFNPAGTGSAGDPASPGFSSPAGGGVPPGTRFPTGRYTNLVMMNESATDDLFYTPTAAQPGFIAGFGVTYHIISGRAATVPDTGATLMLLGLGVAGLLTLRGQLMRNRVSIR